MIAAIPLPAPFGIIFANLTMFKFTTDEKVHINNMPFSFSNPF